MQVVGGGVGVGALLWAVRMVLSEENQPSLEALRDAPPKWGVLLVAASVVSVLINGAMFWVVLRPITRISLVSVLGVNSIATFLTALPFKLSIISRVVLHRRRDGVGYLDLLAWVAGMSALGMATFIPLTAISVWRKETDAVWWVLCLVSVVVTHIVAVVMGRYCQPREGEDGKVRAVVRAMSFGCWRSVRDVRTVAEHFVLRMSDVALLGARFWLAATIIGLGISPSAAMLLGCSYFVIGVVAPSGTLGVREALMGVIGAATGLAIEQATTIALLVGVAELIASGGLGAMAVAVLRLDRLVLSTKGDAGGGGVS